MAQTFNCPSCGASLDYAGGDDPVVRCAYCHSMVIVPEELRQAQQSSQPAIPVFDAPLPVNLGGLMDTIATLKTVKELARGGQQAKAARLYQEAFGVSDQEATDLVSRLAAGQSVALSSVSFDTPVPGVSGTQVQVAAGPQAAQVWQEQIEETQQQQRKQVWAILGVILFSAILAALLFFITLGAPVLCGLLGTAY